VCSSGNETVVKYLIEHEADINKENENGETPLFNACCKGKKKQIIISFSEKIY